MHWTVGSTYTLVTGATEQESEFLQSFMTYEKGGYFATAQATLYNRRLNIFPVGLTRMAFKACVDAGFRPTYSSDAAPCPVFEDQSRHSWLRDYQVEAVNAAMARRHGILWLPTGAGKCLAPATPVLRYDGTLVAASDVRAGDWLMGPDSTPREVLSTTRGRGQMYRIVPRKGEPWECNDVHVLSLVSTATGKECDIPLNEYLAKGNTFKREYKLFQPGVVYFPPPERPRIIDPYFLGIWFGDGHRNLRSGVRVSKPDQAIRDACFDMAAAWGLRVRVSGEDTACPTYSLVGDSARNPLLDEMRDTIPWDRSLPHHYLTASVEERLELLAGLIDTDGFLAAGYFDITQNCKPTIDSIAFLSRSLGFRVAYSTRVLDGSTYHRLTIQGDVVRVPTRIPRRQANPRATLKDAMRVGFSVEPVGVGDYAGFTLSGDGRFLLGDFTVTHNTDIFVGLTRRIAGNVLFVSHRTGLGGNAAQRLQLRVGEVAGTIQGKTFDPQRVTTATLQTLHQRLRDYKRSKGKVHSQLIEYLNSVNMLVFDESHLAPAQTFYEVAMATPAHWRFGLSGTPLPDGDQRSIFSIGCLGPIIYRIEPKRLIDAGVLSKPTINMVRHKMSTPREYYDWQTIYSEAVVNNESRNKLVCDLVDKAAKPFMVFVNQVAHGHLIRRMLNQRGYTVEFMEGSVHDSVREQVRKKLDRGELHGVIATVVWQEGVDIPNLRAVVNAAGLKSQVALLQRMGRGMRVAEGKTTFEVWDIYDHGIRMLQNHSSTRKKHYEREGHTVSIVESP